MCLARTVKYDAEVSGNRRRRSTWGDGDFDGHVLLPTRHMHTRSGRSHCTAHHRKGCTLFVLHTCRKYLVNSSGIVALRAHHCPNMHRDIPITDDIRPSQRMCTTQILHGTGGLPVLTVVDTMHASACLIQESREKDNRAHTVDAKKKIDVSQEKYRRCYCKALSHTLVHGSLADC